MTESDKEKWDKKLKEWECESENLRGKHRSLLLAIEKAKTAKNLPPDVKNAIWSNLIGEIANNIKQSAVLLNKTNEVFRMLTKDYR